jgi:hypothetical protein
VCRLNKSLYSLKQAPLAWYRRFTSYMVSQGFVEAKVDTSRFIYRLFIVEKHALVSTTSTTLTQQ